MRLKKSIREAILVTVCSLIGAVLFVSLVIGASIQEQDRLAVMCAAEVAE